MEDATPPLPERQHRGDSQALNQFAYRPIWARPLVFVLPRSRDAIYADGRGGDLQDLLPDFRSESMEGTAVRAIESRFYVDIATQRDGTYVGHRKMTAVVADGTGTPLANRTVEWRRTSGSNALRFVAGNQLRTALAGADAPTTDANGCAEVTITHPACSVPPADARIVVEATVDGTSSTAELVLTRNDAVTHLDDLARRDRDDADGLWVYQPDADRRATAPNGGIEALQEVLNEVVARHRDVTEYDFVPLDGIYGDATRAALDLYLEHFAGITADADYPYDLSGIGLSPPLCDYLRTEYAPFDPDDEEHRGWIVDRRLLIGDEWDLAADRIDGLLELKEGVVERLQEEMVRTGDAYTTCDTFWLHRPVHDPYTSATAFVCRITQDGVPVRTAPGNAAPALVEPAPVGAPAADGPAGPAADTAVVVNAGDLFESPSVNGAWVEIVHPHGIGWVAAGSSRRVRNDQAHDRNAGTHGDGVWADGVAYSYGCKDTPGRYTRRLESNPHAPPEDNGGDQSRIAAWDEYGDGHNVGRRRSDGAGWPASNQGPHRIPYHTGCDCSGFVQNCITEAVFPPPHDDVRIVPESVVAEIGFNRNDFPLNAVGASAAVGIWRHAAPPATPHPIARPVPEPGTDARQHWVRRGDVIASRGHIVWVADERPAMLNGGIAFDVYNEYGGDRYDLESGARAPLDPNRFLRKALLMPFHYWRQSIPDVGKMYIWHT